MKHRRRFAELALAVSAVLLVAACGSGPGEPPKPAWSPPTWMHGTWEGGSPAGAPVAITATVKASADNLVASFQAGGEEHQLNLAQLTEQGASIQLIPGVSDEDTQRYGITITVGAGSPVHTLLCGQDSDTTMNCIWTEGTEPDAEVRHVLLTKQPG